MDTRFSPQSAKVGIIHPGKMGGTIARGLQGSGHQAHWASEGRSEFTAARAEEFHLIDLGTVDNLIDTCDIIFCIVNGGSLFEYMDQAIARDFDGIWVDANGLWGEESEVEVAEKAQTGKFSYVEAALYGWPHPGLDGYTDEHTMYLSGEKATAVGNLFTCGYWDVMYTEERDGITAKKFKRLRNERERAENIAAGRPV